MSQREDIQALEKHVTHTLTCSACGTEKDGTGTAWDLANEADDWSWTVSDNDEVRCGSCLPDVDPLDDGDAAFDAMRDNQLTGD